MAAGHFGLSGIFITLSHRLQFRFEVKFKPILVLAGTHRIATSGNAEVKEEFF